MLASDATLRITEIFSSLQGESSYSGRPTTFIRLTGCPLRCVYCDSAYAFSGGELKGLSEILNSVSELGNNYVCVTGGEPLAQPECLNLLSLLCDKGYKVSLETSGAIDISEVDQRVKRIVDVKTPASMESDKNLLSNFDCIDPDDELKFVITDKEDFDWSVELVKQYRLFDKTQEVLFSPVFSLATESGEGRVKSEVQSELAAWVLESGLPIRYQLQLHKLLWGDAPGR